MRLIDADELLILETVAYNKAQAKTDDKITRLVNEVVHKKIQMLVSDTPTAYDVDKVVEQCENVAERYADCDEFVCSKCGIHLMEWVKVSIDEDYDDEIHSEYVFKYCPNCGAKIKEGD